MRAYLRHAALAATLVSTLLGGCHEKQELTAPPPPLRPEPEPRTDIPRPVAPRDCEPTDAKSESNAIPFDKQSIPEGNRLTDEAKTKLRLAEGAEVERTLREQYSTDAVADLITALKADPYNVTATYTLAATYARIGRKQCAINLLGRMLEMRTHASKKIDVEQNLDKLLGRKQTLDPNFADMRRDERFRALIAKMCEGTNDANCVYGAQRDNRER